MDSIRETPITDTRMAALAKALRVARGALNKNSLPLVGPFGDALLGKAPEEVENWSYGNYPMTMPPLSNVPVMKTGRGQQTADALLAAPFGGGGEATQAAVPIFSRRSMADILKNPRFNMLPTSGGKDVMDLALETPGLPEKTRVLLSKLRGVTSTKPLTLADMPGIKSEAGRIRHTLETHEDPDLAFSIYDYANQHGADMKTPTSTDMSFYEDYLNRGKMTQKQFDKTKKIIESKPTPDEVIQGIINATK